MDRRTGIVVQGVDNLAAGASTDLVAIEIDDGGLCWPCCFREVVTHPSGGRQPLDGDEALEVGKG